MDTQSTKSQPLTLPIELYQLILTCADFLTRIRLRCANKEFHAKLEIHDFALIDTKYLRLLSNDILRAYPRIQILDASCSLKITNINFMTNLKVLFAFGECGIEDKSIADLNLVKLFVSNNSKITTINHMTKLEVLNAGHECGIDDFGIQNPNLKKLRVFGNSRITNVNHLTKLKVLNAEYGSGINDMGISNLTNLKKLFIRGNSSITNTNHLTQLRVLENITIYDNDIFID